ncbi:hypothetical protein C0995_011412 [Termitomyces sp. Mi166|nr:hypothetical protein C0995_011412 [Termitomyces sp. Mi166\
MIFVSWFASHLGAIVIYSEKIFFVFDELKGVDKPILVPPATSNENFNTNGLLPQPHEIYLKYIHMRHTISFNRLTLFVNFIPSALSIDFNPKALLEVIFPEPTGDITLHPGIQLPINATKGPPFFGAVGHIGKGPFVIAVVDPDAPTPQAPMEAQVRHFLGANFFPGSLQSGPAQASILNNQTAAISAFLQPAPPSSEAHRYIFLLFNQPTGFNSQTLVTPDSSRLNFNLSTFAAATGLGNPIAGTFMLVGADTMAA